MGVIPPGEFNHTKPIDGSDKKVYNKWILTRTLWPKFCDISGARIPMYSNASMRKDGQIETWVAAEEFIMARLKGEL